jgi:hypothetical protein
MIGFSAEFYLACDGEDLLPSYDGNACELTSRDSATNNESTLDGGYDSAPSLFDVQRRTLAASRELMSIAHDTGWISEPTLRFDFHLCPACARQWAELTGKQREAARHKRAALVKIRATTGRVANA